MLSVFITPWMNPTCIHCATRAAWAATTRRRARGPGSASAASGTWRAMAWSASGGAGRHRRSPPRTGTCRHADGSRRPGPAPRRAQGRVAVDLADDLLPRGDDGECARGRDPERVHCLADQVLAQHRADRGLAVAAAGERGPARSLEVEVAAGAGVVDDLAEQQRPPVAEARRVAAELVAGIGLGDGGEPSAPRCRPGPRRRRASAALGVEAELGRQRLVQHEQRWIGDRHGSHGSWRPTSSRANESSRSKRGPGRPTPPSLRTVSGVSADRDVAVC